MPSVMGANLPKEGGMPPGAPGLPGHARIRAAHAHANGGVGMPPGGRARPPD